MGVFSQANVPYVEAGNTLNGCSMLYVEAGVIYYGSAFLTNNAGNRATVAAFQDSQSTTSNVSAFGSAAMLPCTSFTTLINTNTFIRRAQLNPSNTNFLMVGNGCSLPPAAGK